MPWTGSAPNQTYQRTDGTRSGTTVWQAADAAAVDIVADDHDTHDQDMANAVNSCVKKDGGNTPTANLPMGGNKHTNVGNATAITDYATLGQMINSAGAWCSVGGDANAITLTTGFSLTSLTAGALFVFKAAETNTGAVTLAVDSVSAVSLKKNGGAAIESGEIIQSRIYQVIYDGTNFELSQATSTGGDIQARVFGVGSVKLSFSAEPDPGYIRLGESTQTVLKADYPELNAYFENESYPFGSDETSFTLPAAAGYFLRFAATSTAVDTSGARTAGSTQNDQNKAHTHGVGSLYGATSNDGAHSHTSTHVAPGGDGTTGGGGLSDGFTSSATSTSGTHNHSVTIYGSTASDGGDEVRVKNVAMHADMLALPAVAAAAHLGVAGYQYAFDTSNTDAAPAGGFLRFDATPASATQIFIADTDQSGVDLADVIDMWGSSTSDTKGFITIQKIGALGSVFYASIDAGVTDATGYKKLDVTPIQVAGSFSAGDYLLINIERVSDQGDAGSQGPVGPTLGTLMTFSDSTTDADPTAGKFRYNHADPESVTEIYIDNENNAGDDISAYLDMFDDLGSSTNRGIISLIDSANSTTKRHKYIVTGSVTDGSGYRKISVTHSYGTVAFAADAVVSVDFIPTGATGATGAGSGDVSGPASSTANQVALFDGATGKIIKTATTTGILKAASGVLSAASAGTDYYAPSGTDVAIADGGTGASDASGARSNLGLDALALKATIDGSSLIDDGVVTEAKLSSSVQTKLNTVGDGASKAEVSLIALRLADLEGDRANMVDGIADPFDDETDIDTATSTNESYDAANDWYTPTMSGAASPAYGNTGGTGDRTGSITVTTDLGYGGSGDQTALVDGDTSSTGIFYFTGEANSGKYIRFDFGASASKVINAFKWYQQNAAVSQGTWKLQGSNNATDWTDITTGLAIGAGTATEEFTFSNTTGYRYYQLVGTSGSTSSTPYVFEVEFKIDDAPTPNDMTLVSNAFTADSEPTSGRLHIHAQDVGTLNTDFLADISRDGGTTWTTATLVEVGTVIGSVKAYEDSSIDISGQPSGTSMKYRVRTLNNIAPYVTGAIAQWS